MSRPVLRTRSFWVMIFLFALGMGAQVGIFTMLPLYLTQERGMTEGHANTILGLSNIAPLAVVFLSGWITTKIGPRPTMALFLGLTGVTVVLVGLLSGTAMVVCIFLMAALAVGFFAPAFASLSRIVQPTMRSLAAGFGPPVAFLLGGGLAPVGPGISRTDGEFRPRHHHHRSGHPGRVGRDDVPQATHRPRRGLLT